MLNGNRFLNWDHEIHATPATDIAAEVASIIAKRTGGEVVVAMEKGEMEVQTLRTAHFGYGQSFGTTVTPHWHTALLLTFGSYSREVVGRWAHYLNLEEILSLEAAVKTLP